MLIVNRYVIHLEGLMSSLRELVYHLVSAIDSSMEARRAFPYRVDFLLCRLEANLEALVQLGLAVIGPCYVFVL